VTPVPVLASFFGAAFTEDLAESFRASWNVPPTSSILAVTESADHSRGLCRLRWGLVPPWAQDLSFGANTINARAETIASKPSFRAAFLARRCIVPADGYFEWKTTAGEVRQPYYFSRRDGDPLGFAALFEAWSPPGSHDDAELVYSCAIVTTTASGDVEDIHNRMPVVLEPGATTERWLDPRNHDRDELESLLVPAPVGTLTRHRVGRAVGNVRNDGPGLIAEEVENAGLF
jgi:putative SOS response-associated peptidase YedK